MRQMSAWINDWLKKIIAKHSTPAIHSTAKYAIRISFSLHLQNTIEWSRSVRLTNTSHAHTHTQTHSTESQNWNNKKIVQIFSAPANQKIKWRWSVNICKRYLVGCFCGFFACDFVATAAAAVDDYNRNGIYNARFLGIWSAFRIVHAKLF